MEAAESSFQTAFQFRTCWLAKAEQTGSTCATSTLEISQIWVSLNCSTYQRQYLQRQHLFWNGSSAQFEEPFFDIGADHSRSG